MEYLAAPMICSVFVETHLLKIVRKIYGLAYNTFNVVVKWEIKDYYLYFERVTYSCCSCLTFIEHYNRFIKTIFWKRKCSSKLCNNNCFTVCKDEYYGPGCNKTCNCHPYKSKDQICDPQTGQCKCKPGFKSRDCSKGKNIS